MAENRKSDTVDIGCFASLGELRLEHLKLMERDAGLKEHGSESEIADIGSFIARAKATGTVLSEMVERREAQGILDYWSSSLVSIGGADLRTWSQPRLENYDRAAKDGAKPADAEQTKAALSKLDDNARQLIRMSALARQWKTGGRYDGYLLVGSALEDARKLHGQDADVDELIRASDNHVTARNRKRWWGAMTLIAVLTTMVVVLMAQLIILAKKNETLKAQTKFVVKQSQQITNQRDVIKGQNQQTIEIIDELRKSSDRARSTNSRSIPVDQPVDVFPPVMDTTDELTADAPPESPQSDGEPKAYQPSKPPNIKLHTLPDAKSFDVGSDEDRLSAALDFNRRLRGENNSTADQLALIKALVELTSKDKIALLSPKGRHYLLFVLSLVPVHFWTKPEWQEVKNEFSQNLTALQSAINVKQIILEPKSLQYLDDVRNYIGLAK